MAQATAKWIDAAKTFEGRVAAHIAVADIADPIEAIKDVVLSAYIGETIALRDRNHHNSPWRKIYLCKIEHEKWRLSDVENFGLNEENDGCPFSGFSTESIIDDIGMEYYTVLDFKEVARDLTLEFKVAMMHTAQLQPAAHVALIATPTAGAAVGAPRGALDGGAFAQGSRGQCDTHGGGKRGWTCDGFGHPNQLEAHTVAWR